MQQKNVTIATKGFLGKMGTFGAVWWVYSISDGMWCNLTQIKEFLKCTFRPKCLFAYGTEWIAEFGM